jgi:hypothetical protein
MLENLSFSKFKAYFRIEETTELPSFTGSTFRGALGHAMRKVRSGWSRELCGDCPLRSYCRYGDLYAYLFEAPADHPFIAETCRSLALKHETYPQPFILDPPPGGVYQPGQFLSLSFTLVGKAIECFPFMACALRLVGENPLGRSRSRGSVALEAIVDGMPSEDGEEALIFDGRTGRIVGPAQVLDFDLIRRWITERNAPDSETDEQSAHIRFLTPFRFKQANRLGAALDFQLFMRNVLRRLTLLSVHSPLSFDIDFRGLLAKAEAVQTEKSELRWLDWERYSNRQKERMFLGGFVGDIVFVGRLAELLPFLKMCELLNVGKNVAFGLGKFVMIDGR